MHSRTVHLALGALLTPCLHHAWHRYSVVVADTLNSRVQRIRMSDGSPISNASYYQDNFGRDAKSDLRHPKGLCSVSHE